MTDSRVILDDVDQPSTPGRQDTEPHFALACAECGRRWDDSSERWRMYLDIDDDVLCFCSGCAAREFADG